MEALVVVVTVGANGAVVTLFGNVVMCEKITDVVPPSVVLVGAVLGME